jgi:hypothetical protein
MNKEMLKSIMSNMDIAKDLDEYGKNKLSDLSYLFCFHIHLP